MIPVQITTEAWHDADGSASRTQTVVAPTMAKALAMYRLLAEIDAMAATGEALERIAGE